MNKLKQKKITFLYQVFAVFSLLFQSFYPALATLAPVYAEEAGIIVADLDKKPASEESAVVYQFESVELKADENEVMGVETGEVTEPEAAETDEALPETAGAVETEEEVREVEESGAIEEVAQSAESDDEGTASDKSLFKSFTISVYNPHIVNIDAYFVKTTYQGIGVDIHVDELTDATKVEVKVERANGVPVVKTNKVTGGVLNTLNTGVGAVVTAPIVIQQGTYDEAGSSSWNQPSETWDSTNVPEKIIVTIERDNGNKPSLVAEVLLAGIGTNLATLEEVMPAPVNNHPDPDGKHQLSLGGIIYRDHKMNDCYGKTSCEDKAENLGEGWTMNLYQEDDGEAWSLLQSVQTNSSGNFNFSQLTEAGTYHFCEVVKPGWTQQVQNWSGTPYHIATANMSGNAAEGPYCRTVQYDDTSDKSNKAYFGNVDTTKPVTVIVGPDDGDVYNSGNITVNFKSTDAQSGIGKVIANIHKVGKTPSIVKPCVNTTVNPFASEHNFVCDVNIDDPLFDDGEYYIKANALDAGGNLSNTVQWDFVVDKTAPSVPTNLRYYDVTLGQEVACGVTTTRRTLHPKWDANEEGDFLHYEYTSFDVANNPQGWVIGLNEVVMNSTTFVHNWIPPVDGTYGFAVRAVDLAGNKSDWAIGGTKTLDDSCQYTVDGTAPTAPVITKPSPEQYFNAIPILNEWAAALDTGTGVAKYQVAYLYDDSHTFTGSTCPGEEINSQLLSGCRDVDAGLSRGHVPGLSEQGGVTIWVRAIDNAGNVGAWSEPVHYYYDATAPNAPSLVSPLNNAFVRGELLVNEWTSVPDAHHYIYESYHDAGATNLRHRETFNTNSKSASNVTDTTFWWRVKAVDAAGNESDWSDLWKVTVDNTFPVVNIVQPGDEAFLRGTVEVLGEITETNLNNYNVALYPGTDHASTWNFSNRVWQKDGASNTLAYNLDTTEFADGHYMIRLAAWDKAGNRDPMGNSGTGVSVQIIDVVIDNTAPTSTITPPEGATVENDTVIVNNWDGTIAGTANDNLSGVDKVLISIQKDDGTYWDGTTWVDSGTELIFNTNSADPTNWQYALPSAPTEGTYTIQSHAVDQAGNQEDTAKLIIVLDKTIPEVSLSINPANPDGKRSWYQTQPTVTLTSASSDTVGIEYQWNGNSGVWQSYASPLTPAQGKQVLYYRALDAAGNHSAIGVKNIAFDQEVPLAVPSFTIDRNGNEATIEWEKASDNTGIHGYEIIWELEDQNLRRSHKVGASTREYTITDLEDGHWRVRVRAEDLAGWTATAGSKGLTIGEGEVAGVTDEDEIIADGMGGSLLNYFTGLAGEVLGATDENLTDEAVGTGNGLGAAALEGTEGQVAGAETTCETWRYFLPALMLLLALVSFVLVELLFEASFAGKALMHLLLAGGAILVITLLADGNCYTEGSALSFAANWFWAITLGLGALVKMLGAAFTD